MRDVARRFSMSASMRSAPKRRTRFHPRKATAIPAASDSNAIMISISLCCEREDGRPAVLPSGRRLPGEADVFARLGLVDLQRLPIHVFAIEAGDGGMRFCVGAELHEAEALRL